MGFRVISTTVSTPTPLQPGPVCRVVRRPQIYSLDKELLMQTKRTRFLGVDTRSVETTIRTRQNIQMCHSLRCKQIDKSTADQMKSIFPNNAGAPKLTLAAAAHARVTESKLVERMNIESEESFTPRNVYSSIFQAHTGFVNSEPLTSESYERNFERTYDL